jgi:hypothetical protein
MTDLFLSQEIEQQLRDFDAVFGPPEAWEKRAFPQENAAQPRQDVVGCEADQRGAGTPAPILTKTAADKGASE